MKGTTMVTTTTRRTASALLLMQLLVAGKAVKQQSDQLGQRSLEVSEAMELQNVHNDLPSPLDAVVDVNQAHRDLKGNVYKGAPGVYVDLDAPKPAPTEKEEASQEDAEAPAPAPAPTEKKLFTATLIGFLDDEGHVHSLSEDEASHSKVTATSWSNMDPSKQITIAAVGCSIVIFFVAMIVVCRRRRRSKRATQMKQAEHARRRTTAKAANRSLSPKSRSKEKNRMKSIVLGEVVGVKDEVVEIEQSQFGDYFMTYDMSSSHNSLKLEEEEDFFGKYSFRGYSDRKPVSPSNSVSTPPKQTFDV